MNKILYSHGDSVVWGAELENKETERFSYHIAQQNGWIDCNNASAGVSNDYIYRQTMRDVSHWVENGVIWSEENGWVKSNDLYVTIGWTSPTRFEWWTGEKYQQERLWVGYDKWGENDKDRSTEDEFVLNQTEDIPSYIRTFNHIIGLSAFLHTLAIPHHFFNTFYEYNIPKEPSNLIDAYGRPTHQTDLNSLWQRLPLSFKNDTMYSYIKENGGELLPRNHPTKESHEIWANYYKTII